MVILSHKEIVRRNYEECGLMFESEMNYML